MAAAAIAVRQPQISPSSPFAELLRRSRFASYDPLIRQTYSSPPAYAHRGNWGLKRPISQRRRNAYITLKAYEEHAQYVEWNNAESQVRFVRRVEEMNVLPRVVRGTGWAKGLGAVEEGSWVVDSEFARAGEGEGRALEVEKKGEEAEREAGVDLTTLGMRGPGGYSMKRVERRATAQNLIPNIDAMKPKEFERYLRKLRELRPAFTEHLRKNVKKPGAETMSLYELAHTNAEAADYHMAFIGQHTEAEYNALKEENDGKPKIKPQPHRSGGLLYSHPTILDTYFTTKPQPGIVLQERIADPGRFSATQKREDKVFIASFGGLAAELNVKDSASTPPLALDGTVDPAKVDKSIASMRVKSLHLEKPPRVVGRLAQGLKGVGVRATVMVDVPHAERARDNACWPGSREYVRAQPVSTKPMRVGVLPLQLTPRYASPYRFEGKVPLKTAGERRMRNSKIFGALKDTLNREVKDGEGGGAGPEGL